MADRLKEIARCWEQAGSLPALAQRLIALLDNHTFEALSAQAGSLHVVPLNRCGYTGREHLYVLGMDEGSFPGGAAEDPILLEDTLPAETALDLERRGHRVEIVSGASRSGFGLGQIIMPVADPAGRRVYWGASDPRGDGCALGLM